MVETDWMREAACSQWFEAVNNTNGDNDIYQGPTVTNRGFVADLL